VSLALRDKHLADLLHLTRPEGAAAPRDGRGRLEARMVELIAAENFFTGTNPYRIVAVLEEDP
jgi:hypothetical protein